MGRPRVEHKPVVDEADLPPKRPVGRPRKWASDVPVKQVHLDVPELLVDQFKVAAAGRGLTLVDWFIDLGTSAIGQPFPLPLQERLPLTAA